MFSLTFYILSLCVCSTYSFKMVIFVMDLSNSQLLYNVRVAEELSAAGHKITLVLISPQADRDNSDVKISENIGVYRVNATIQFSRKEMEEKQAEFAFKETSGFRLFKRISMQTSTIVDICRATLERKEFLKWLEQEHFDLAYAHMFDVCTIGLIHNAKIPSWIWLNSGSVMDYVATLVGIPIIPSYVPPMMMAAAGEMNFVERVKSFIGHTLMKFFWKRLIANPETDLFRRMIRPDFPDLLDLASKCPLVMANTNDLYEMPRPTLAKVVNIGGIGMESQNVKSLPKEIEEIMQKGDGVVLFSFGSVAASHKMPEEWKVIFLKAFKKLSNYQFLMRYESDDLKGKLSENVHLFKWLPQSDILQHPRTKAFITHGGYNSVQEAIRSGVPLISIPLFGDQPKNARLAEHHGLGLILHRDDLSVPTVSRAIQEVTKNPKYSTSAQRLLQMIKHQPVSPSHLLVKWSEFTAEFKTLENLEPAGNKLNFFQYHSLDVIAFLTTVLIVAMLLVAKITRFVWTYLLSRVFTSKKQKLA